MSLRSVSLFRPLVLIPVLVLLLAPLPALAGERAGGQSAVWGAELLGGVLERVAGWLDSVAGVMKLGPEMDPNGAPASEEPREGGAVTELGPDMDPDGVK